VRVLEERLAASLRSAVEGLGMTERGPEFIADLLVRLFDRTFEFVFLSQRTAREQKQIVLISVDIVATYIERYVTPAGLEGISAEEFVRTLAEHPLVPQSQPAASD